MQQQLYVTGLAPQQLLEKLDVFIAKIEQLLDLLGLDLRANQLDHIALRINDPQLAQVAHQAWLAYGEEISCAQINGRPIIVIRFNQPLQVSHWQIECLELPYPAQGKTYPEQSWEHVEFVIPSQALSAEAFCEELKGGYPSLAEKWHQLNELGIKVKLSSPQGEGERLANPTVAFQWQGGCIKLHPHPLQTIVESERA
ncbi:VOC family protein [Vibrio cholerae]|nr:VOC family protein [Vibrio cholerae]EGR2120654.1 VOC family protein [Vibrio cholerae]EJL6305208.1 VOC family protein [Vibrio cholerae]EJL6758586.1 VOC family protein [Vibrio cholerae]EJP6366362.1 VOC family protein [Vibrio cholerae]